MSQKKLKAFQVSDEWGDQGGVIVFAKHNVVARREGADELGIEFSHASCRRAHWADADRCARHYFSDKVNRGLDWSHDWYFHVFKNDIYIGRFHIKVKSNPEFTVKEIR